jgi:hypothetical protein
MLAVSGRSLVSHVVARPLVVLASVVVLGAFACPRGDSSGPDLDDPLEGLAQVARNQTTAGQDSMDTSGSGRIVGRVRGYELPGSGTDTLATVVALAGVRVTAYERTGVGDQTAAGAKRAETLSSATGEFALPVLPADEYVVTFVPPAGMPYAGGWTVGRTWSGSGERPWSIMLRKTD